ncbi:ankyrin repeat domain-containing protein [Wolbachia endosymbiont of Spodoptera picta]|uniref:ankyrin repeat domain-containing protein n=1 Tax=Wolbachia endosymbiont of Spodoptera picta TaxID=2769078 RepID=UPI001BAB9CE2|nr:ankyrin repeat domain-containing protein [Wolbachia endosymbiont of Spodoptera picta]QUI59930.1 ankyrin repeat domain-containing protein [Wolbachia endosymbiont of Spodoptera picta]
MKKLERLRKNLFAAIDELNIKKVKRYVKKARYINKEKEIINGKKDVMAPIHLAVYKGSLEIVRFLLKNNANINAVSDGCLVPYSYVTTMSSKTEIKEMIYHCTSSTTSQVIQGFTALHLAFFYCRLDIANLLLNNNIINVNIRNANGKTAFEVIPGYESFCSDGCDMSKIYLDLSKFHKNNCTELLLSARINTKLELEAVDTPDAASSTANPFSASTRANTKIGLEAVDTPDPAPSSAVKPFSFINSIFSWVTTATLNGLFSSAPTLLPAQQSVDHLAGSPIGSSQVDFNATALLVDVVVKKFTGKKYSRLLDNPPLTRLSIIEKKLETALSKCKKLYQCPESSLSNLTISKGIHQKSL